MCLDDTLQAHGLRSSVRNCQHINSKGIFQSGLLIEHIGQILYVRTFLQVNDDTDSFFGRLIGISTMSVVFLVSTRLQTSFKNFPIPAPIMV